MKIKLIRDSVHGYIEVPEIIVNEIIDTPIFQRLRQIEQTSMRTLYPSAHHDRFVHSLGVYHLGKLAYSGLVSNIKSDDIFRNHEKFWTNYGKCFELACLLHDCGHSPMSHSFEYGYLDPHNLEDCQNKKSRLLAAMTNGINEIDEKEKLAIEQVQTDLESYFSDPSKIVPHEMVSAILASEYFAKNGSIKRILDSLLDTEVPQSALAEYIVFIQRAIIGLPYRVDMNTNSDLHIEDCFKNCLISLLNGNFFDVDKLDYIVRDTIESGANNLTIDIPRILSALTLVEIHHFDIGTKVENMELNNSIYFTGCQSELFDKSATNESECALELTGVKLKGKFQGVFEFSRGNNYFKLIDEDEEYSINSGKKNFNGLTELEVRVENACKMMGRFIGQIETLIGVESSRVGGIINATLSGNIKGKIIGKINTSAENNLTYEVGYSKNALSVIEDTLVARNRLYLWIYAHHKVTFNDYLLRNGVLNSFLDDSYSELGELEKKAKANKMLSEVMNIDNIFFSENKSKYYLLNDGDLIHSMKMSIVDHSENNISALNWLSRKHMYPIWKSYVEYNSFFANLSLKQRKDLWTILFNGMEDAPYQSLPNEANSNEFDNSILKQFSDAYQYVWIKPSGFKLKEMDVSNIYIVLSDNSVKRLKDVISQAKVTEQYVDESFFYLYTSEMLDPDNKLLLISFLKKMVKNKTTTP